MKNQGFWIGRIVMIIICAFIVVYMGNHIMSSRRDPFVTVTAVWAETTESVPVSGVIVRDDNVIPLPSVLYEFAAGEGDRISVGQAIAVSFKDESARQNSLLLAEKTEQRELLEYIAGYSGISKDKTLLDAEIRFLAAELLSGASSGKLTSLSNQTADIKALLFHQNYSYEGAAVLLPRIETLREEISALSSVLSDTSTALYAERPGLFSALTDGLEDVWTPGGVRNITVSDFYEKSGLRAGAFDGRNGRLVRGWSWRFVCVLPAAQAQNLGKTAVIRFPNGLTHNFSAEYVSAAENGECAVVFYTDHYINRVISERRMRGEMIVEEYKGIRIPPDGLRVDSSTGEQYVFCLVARNIVRKNVTLISGLERDNYYLAEFYPEKSNALRPGDEIVIAGRALFDGRVIR
jgi:hypothetical protein